MAELTITGRQISSYGAYKRETGQFTYDDSADVQIKTKLSSIVFFSCTCNSSAKNRQQEVAYNSVTSTNDVATKQGNINLVDDTGQLTNDETYMYEAIGTG